jgi:hypothetical protein
MELFAATEPQEITKLSEINIDHVARVKRQRLAQDEAANDGVE